MSVKEHSKDLKCMREEYGNKFFLSVCNIDIKPFLLAYYSEIMVAILFYHVNHKHTDV